MVENITGLVLAGGRGTRMGGLDKGLVLLDGRPMVEHVVLRLRPQVADIVISANRNQERYAKFGHRVVTDTLDGYLGPLAGIASCLDTIATEYAVTVPCDSPLIRDDLVTTLWAALQRDRTDLAVAHDGWRLQPAFMLLRRQLLPDLVDSLGQGELQVEKWIGRHKCARARFRGHADSFANVNDPNERHLVESQLRDQRLS